MICSAVLNFLTNGPQNRLLFLKSLEHDIKMSMKAMSKVAKLKEYFQKLETQRG